MRPTIRETPWEKEQRRVRRVFRRDVVSVKEIYRTKRKGTPVGEAMLECGHETIVDMIKPARWRVCWTCVKNNQTVRAAPADGRKGEP